MVALGVRSGPHVQHLLLPPTLLFDLLLPCGPGAGNFRPGAGVLRVRWTACSLCVSVTSA